MNHHEIRKFNELSIVVDKLSDTKKSCGNNNECPCRRIRVEVNRRYQRSRKRIVFRQRAYPIPKLRNLYLYTYIYIDVKISGDTIASENFVRN